MAKKHTETSSCRLNRVGGQAVLEGVMMKAGNRTVTTCRKDDGSLVVNDGSFESIRKKVKILGLPIIRGVVNFIEMMALSVNTLNVSADALGIEEEEGKAEKWMRKHLGIGITDAIMVVSLVLGLALSLFLFMYLPTLVAEGINWLYMTLFSAPPIHPTVMAVIDGVVKVGIFLTYLALVALMPDIKRTFMYHGAEHKSIACFEAGDELTPENAMKHRRFHPRCGTSFMFLMIALGILAGVFVRNLLPGLAHWQYALIKLAILPLVMGIGYEILMIAGKHDNIITRAISAPGMWVQRLTTKEPTEDMLEVAITSIKCALRDDFPEFREFYENKEWEKRDESAEATEVENTVAAAESAEADIADVETADPATESVEDQSATGSAEGAIAPEAANG